MRPIGINYSKQSYSSRNMFLITDRNKRINLIQGQGLRDSKLANINREANLQGVIIEHNLSEINKAIQESKYILDLKDDWDDEGSVGYDMSTWKRTIEFLLTLARNALNAFGVVIDTPKIYHGPNGSIDMLWKNENYKILVNFPKDGTQPASFYGNTASKETVKGTFALDSNSNLMLFLIGAKQCTR